MAEHGQTALPGPSSTTSKSITWGSLEVWAKDCVGQCMWSAEIRACTREAHARICVLGLQPTWAKEFRSSALPPCSVGLAPPAVMLITALHPRELITDPGQGSATKTSIMSVTRARNWPQPGELQRGSSSGPEQLRGVHGEFMVLCLVLQLSEQSPASALSSASKH